MMIFNFKIATQKLNQQYLFVDNLFNMIYKLFVVF